MYSGLTTAQLEMLLAHELAHIKRHDYLINFLQTLIEIIFFFHPSVKWISKQAREEREYCCDDIAIHHCGNAVAYATTLTDAEMLRPHNIPQLAMAASGGNLKRRIFRAVGQQNCSPNFSGQWLVCFFSLFLISSILTSSAIGVTVNNSQTNTISKIELIEAPKTDKSVKLKIEQKSVNDKAETKLENKEVVSKKQVDSMKSDRPISIAVNSEPVILQKNTIKKKKQAISKSESPVTTKPSKNTQVDDKGSTVVVTHKTKTNTEKNTLIEKMERKNKPKNHDTKKIKLAKLDSKALQPSVKADTSVKISKAIEQDIKPLKTYPKLVEGEFPYYPSIANKRKLTAEVRVSFDVTESGRVRKIHFHNDVHRSFRKSIKSELKNWRFEPGKIDGKITRMKLTKIFNFGEPSGKGEKASPQTGSRIKRT